MNEELDLHDCPVKLQLQIDIAIDEIITNIASYAYGSGSGDFTVEADVQEELGLSGCASATAVFRSIHCRRPIRIPRFPPKIARSADSASIW